MGRAFLRRPFARSLSDLEPGDAVRVKGYSGVAWVREINGDVAVIVWAKDRRDILPLFTLRRVKPCGRHYDARGG